MPRETEGEFLIRLAPVWLACCWRLLGKPLRNCNGWPKAHVGNELLGCLDYAAEMRLVCAECRRS